MEKILSKPYKLYNLIQNYDWGTVNDEAIIPRLLGIKAEDNLPYAELWIGGHQKAPSQIMDNGQLLALTDVMKKFSHEILGKIVAEKFNGQLPFLLKILSARQALSIQMHPNKSQAEKLHRTDPKNYPDENHKPEIAIAIDSLDALVGLKPLSEIISALTSYRGFDKYFGKEMFNEFTKESSGDESIAKTKFYYSLMKTGEDKNKLVSLLDEIEMQILIKSDPVTCERYFLENRKIFGDDIGLLSFFFYNHISLEKDDGIFIDAGIPHAYLRGNIVECMANSDNVIRGGLTPKFKDVDNLLSMIDHKKTKPVILNPTGKIKEYPSYAEEFILSKLTIDGNEQIGIKTGAKVQIVLVLEGEIIVMVKSTEEKYNFLTGESFLIPSIIEEYVVVAHKKSSFILVTVPGNEKLNFSEKETVLL